MATRSAIRSDTVGPCLDIFIKIMSTVSLISVAVFNHYNVLDWVLSLFRAGA
ncbi:MAG: hypothetical protein R2881_07960 [Eubacteriales bacterium]